jgi:hypothetical protein
MTTIGTTKGKPRTCEYGCDRSIQMTTTGDVNVYTCTCDRDESPCPPTHSDCSTDPIAPGQCVPLGIGAKPKQSQRSKLDKLLANSPVPSALAAGFVQTSRRYLAGRTPANAFEADTFGVLQAMPAELQRTLSCALGSFEALGAAERDQLVDSTLVTDLDTPIDPERLATAFAREL